MKPVCPWWRGERFWFLLAVCGWAAFAGTFAGQMSIWHRLSEARQRVSQSQAERDALEEQLRATQRHSEELFQTSRRLDQEREQIIRSLQEKLRDLEARLRRHELSHPNPPGEPPP